MADSETDKPIRFISEFVRTLRETPATRRRLFRGQNIDRPLLPKIARLAEKKGIPFSEVTNIGRNMLQRFRRESVPMLGTVRAESDWELLSIAQHQGMPTRLLGWTANALAGLWFAVSTEDPAFPMTFPPMRKLSKACRIAAILLLACLPVAAQITFSGQIAVNTITTSVDLANPVYYDATDTSLDVRTPGALTCAGYPNVGIWLHRGGTDALISEGNAQELHSSASEQLAYFRFSGFPKTHGFGTVF